jgi:hypothetical protein
VASLAEPFLVSVPRLLVESVVQGRKPEADGRHAMGDEKDAYVAFSSAQAPEWVVVMRREPVADTGKIKVAVMVGGEDEKVRTALDGAAAFLGQTITVSSNFVHGAQD